MGLLFRGVYDKRDFRVLKSAGITIGGKVSYLRDIYKKVVTKRFPPKMPTSNKTALNFIKNGIPYVHVISVYC